MPFLWLEGRTKQSSRSQTWLHNGTTLGAVRVPMGRLYATAIKSESLFLEPAICSFNFFLVISMCLYVCTGDHWDFINLPTTMQRFQNK